MWVQPKTFQTVLLLRSERRSNLLVRSRFALLHPVGAAAESYGQLNL